MTIRRVLRKNSRAGVELQEIITGGRGTGATEHRTYIVYDLLAKEHIDCYTRKEAEKEYRRLVRNNLKFLREFKKKIEEHKKEIRERKSKHKKHKRKR